MNAVIVVPWYKKDLSQEEAISLRHLQHFLGRHEVVLLAPEGLPIAQAYPVQRFAAEFFASIDAYSRLLLSRHFYDRFRAYDYLLIYQLDCLVFSDRLEEWCEAGFDYLGAPWFTVKNDPSSGFSRVGNGGLSLRRVEGFLNVLDSKRSVVESKWTATDLFSTVPKDIDALPLIQRHLKKLKVLRAVRRGVAWYTANYTLNEDHFWSDRANLFHPEFKVAPVRQALQFAFEAHPRYCFEQNNFQLPFGCHAWSRWDREFWESYLLTEPTGI